MGFVYHATATSSELLALTDEVIGAINVLMGGIDINDETLPISLIDRLGPKSNYISESHTLKHFRKFWVPKVFDRSFAKAAGAKNCEEMLRERTIDLLKTYQPKPLSEGLVTALKKVEKTWFERVGLKHEYPKRKPM